MFFFFFIYLFLFLLSIHLTKFGKGAGERGETRRNPPLVIYWVLLPLCTREGLNMRFAAAASRKNV